MQSISSKPVYTPRILATSISSALADCYKLGHYRQYKAGTSVIYSTFTPRASKYSPDDQIVSFGFQVFIQKYLIDYMNEHFFNRSVEEIVSEYQGVMRDIFDEPNANADHIKALHQLGFLPLEIKAVPEGMTVGIKTPVMTIVNTEPGFFWLTNYIETLLSCSLWLMMTSASIARKYKKLFNTYADLTCDNRNHVPFQAHDFSMRGLSSLESAEYAAAGHATSFIGSDTVPVLSFIRTYYPTLPTTTIIKSVNATEHSVMSSYGTDELETFRTLIEDIYPTGAVSIVADTYDFWRNITVTLPALKQKIMAREGKVIIRPDSGDPVDILCGNPSAETIHEQKGLIECLWDIFGGTLNQKGFKVFDPHIGAIYGDSINLERAELICQKLMEKGFASSNVVFGIGSLAYQYHTRDTFGFAVKSTDAIINGIETPIFKDPKTDSGLKKSQRGRIKVVKKFDEATQCFHLCGIDGLTLESDYSDDVLQLIFRNGELFNPISFEKIRENVAQSLA